MKEMRRVLALLLCFVMLVGYIPAAAFAAETETEPSSVVAETPVAEEVTFLDLAPVAAEAAGVEEGNDDIDWLFVATDRHTNTTVIGSIIDNMESQIGENELDYLALGGDMVGSASDHPAYNSSTVLAEVTSAAASLSAENVDIVAGVHDMNVTDDAGIVLPYGEGGAEIYEGDRFYVYGVEESCISDDFDSETWSAEAQKFVTWANGDGIDKSKVIVVVSHYPLHANRDDNDGAYVWHQALNTVAAADEEGNVARDVIFFHGHNHTVDSTEYVYNVGETLTLQNGSATVSGTISYTYATAGYLNANKKATLVMIDDATVSLTRFGTSGEGTITAEFDRAEEEAEPAYLSSIAVTSAPAKLTYVTGEELDLTGLVVTGTYSDGTTADVTADAYVFGTVDMTAAGEKTVTLAVSDGSIVFKTSFTVTVEQAAAEGLTLEKIEITQAPDKTEYLLSQELDLDGMVVTATFSDGSTQELAYKPFSTSTVYGGYELDNFSMYVEKAHEMVVTYTYGDVTCTATTTINVWDEDFADGTTGISVHLTGDYGVTAASVAQSANTAVAEAVAELLFEGYQAWDISLVYDEGYTATDAEKTVTLPLPEGVTNPAVYFVSEEGAVEAMPTVNNGDGTVTFTTTHFSTYVVGNGTQITVPDPEEPTGSQEITTTDKKTVYILSTPSNGNSYLIANSNSASNTTRYLLTRDGTSISDPSVTIKSGDVDGDGDTDTYIELDDASDALWTVSGSSSFTLANSGYNLYYNNSLQASSRSETEWTYRSNMLYNDGTRTDHYIRYYNSNWTTTTTSNSATSVYFYIPTEVDVETTQTVTGTYSVSVEDLKLVVASGSTAKLTSALLFTPASGEAQEVAGTPSYELVSNGDPNGIISALNGDTVTFSGTYGKALIKVSYATASGTATNYITLEASEPWYSINLHQWVEDPDSDEGSSLQEITAPVQVKGVVEGDVLNLWAVIMEYTEEFPQGNDLGTLEDPQRIRWVVSNEAIASVNAVTGELTFTGAEGVITVTAYYLDENKEKVLCEDTVTISVTISEYVVEGDGTDDFPEYPSQGAVRINKTAEAVGNFSATGISKVEISMTGVPYGTSLKTDVVVMVDMTSSMEDNDITAAQLAVQELIEGVVYDKENDKYDENIQLFVSSFSSGTSTDNIVITDHLDNVTIGSKEELDAAKAVITDSTDGFRDDRHSTNGTHYGVALADVYATLTREGHAEKQYVVFVTDGVPTKYFYLNTSGSYTEVTGNNSDTNSLAAGWFDDDGEVTDSFQTEYYSYLIKSMDVPLYTVGANLSAGSDASDLINHMSSNYSADGKTSTGETKYSFTCTTSGGVTDEVLAIFKGIAQGIREAATNVVVEDKIGSDYTMTFKLPNSGITKEETGMDEFYIQVVEYTLDENKERTGDPAVKEKFLFNADGTLKSHVIGTVACGETCDHVTFTDGIVTAIDGTYFDYESSEDGEFLYWYEEKISTTELALQYFAYLDNSAGNISAGQQKEPDTYYTNDYATVTYTNYKGSLCQKEFPVPSMTWKGAKVSYVFYLVNEAGQPVNRAGKVIPFAEALYVTDEHLFDVTWNDSTGITKLDAAYVAQDIVPEVYELYDSEAYYEILVYQTEGVDPETSAVNYNHFIIEGSSGIANKNTTKVFNTKAGTRFDEYGAYSATAGTYTSTKSGKSYTIAANEVTTNIDYANTTVAFAVVWRPSLKEDAVVVDYGLDVEINVITNDALAAGVNGVMLSAPSDVELNTGTYTADKGAKDTVESVNWSASTTGNLNNVLFHQKNMNFTEPVKFYYQAGVNYYIYDASGTATLNTTNMYSSVTVIPATTVYYEDTFLNLSSYTATEKDADDNYIWPTTPDTENKWEWEKSGGSTSGTQQVDRPGDTYIDASYDANNEYGYDSAYDSCATHSLNSAAVITVNESTRGEATFSFYGTGFDIIGTTSGSTGTLMIQVTDENGKTRTKMVDTYYGSKNVPFYVTYTYNGKDWIETGAEEVAEMGTPTAIPEGTYTNGQEYKIFEMRWVEDKSSNNTLYQVPVMKWTDLAYGKYTVKLIASYGAIFDNKQAHSYKLYLDAIRIYDPTGNLNDTANNAYKADGEGWPVYQELRNLILDAGNVKDNLKEDETRWTGLIFIDNTKGTQSQAYTIEDYENYGPNNELYLAANQSIAFELDVPSNVADVQIGMKSADGAEVLANLTKYALAEKKDEDGNVVKDESGNILYEVASTTASITEGSSATDRYYSIGSYVPAPETGTKTYTLKFQNVGGGILSITNIKFTYKEAPQDTNIQIGMTNTTAASVLKLMNQEPAVETKPEVTLDADLNVSIRNKSVKEGGNIVVKATTTSDVEYLMVNGEKITAFTENKSTGVRTWSFTVKAEQQGNFDVKITAFAAEKALQTVTETVEITAQNTGVVQQIVGQLIGMLTR